MRTIMLLDVNQLLVRGGIFIRSKVAPKSKESVVRVELQTAGMMATPSQFDRSMVGSWSAVRYGQ